MIVAESLKPLPDGWEMPASQSLVVRWGAALRDAVRAAWQWGRSMQVAMRARSERRSLRVAESVSLGDKRSVYLVEVDGQRLLLGASAAGLTLLSQLPPAKEPWQRTVKDLVFSELMEGCEPIRIESKPERRKKPRPTVAEETV